VGLAQRIIGQLLHLIGNCVCDRVSAVTDVHAPQTGHRVKITPAIGVPDPTALTARDFQWRVVPKIVVLQVAVPEVIYIEFTS
jgi:hypothetical protein